VSLPAEILFHRFFQLEEHGPQRRREYRGKQDLEALNPQVGEFLKVLQASLNESLRLAKQDVPEHVEHPPFHLDYIDSTVRNAIAFCFEGFSFIGITIPLIDSLWDACIRLSSSERIAELLNVSQTPEQIEAVHSVFFRIQLFFVVAHEYTHHVHGHVARNATFFEEIEDSQPTGCLEQQAREVDADGYAAYHVLSHLIDGDEGRNHALRLLGRNREASGIQDEILFSAFVVAVGAFFFARPPLALDEIDVCNLTHPPQAARMNYLMHTAIAWCKHYRPSLETYMTRERFQILMSAAAQAVWGMNGGRDWVAQNEFLRSERGGEYQTRLDELVKEHVQSL
jgi:hypothetical protein